MQDSRRLIVLRLIIEKYIEMQEPIGSSTVAHSFPYKISSATIRNDMAFLEEEGYLIQPHTSSGRIPTEKGYRTFVNHLTKIMPLSIEQRRSIKTLFQQAMSIDDALHTAAHLLAHVTGQVAIVASPSPNITHLRHFELVKLALKTYLMVVIVDTGKVYQSTVVAQNEYSDTDIEQLVGTINTNCHGLSIEQFPEKLKSYSHQTVFLPLDQLIQKLVSAVTKIERNLYTEGLYISGISQLIRPGVLNSSSVSSLLDILEEQVGIMKLMETLSTSTSSLGVDIGIGSEMKTKELNNIAVITSKYAQSIEGSFPLSYIGSIGPTNMNYPGTIAAVRTIADYLSVYIQNKENT